MSMGVRINGADAPSKAAVKRALRDDPASVYFYGTSLFGEPSPERDGFGIPGNARREDANPPFANRVQSGIVTFVGPNPYTKRTFYGQLKWNREGRLDVA